MLATEREAFERDGAAVLRGVFKDWVEPLREGVEYNATHPGPSFRNYTPEKTTGRFFGDYCNWQRIEPFKDFVEHSSARTGWPACFRRSAARSGVSIHRLGSRSQVSVAHRVSLATEAL
jgi:hypothetical protein